MANTGPSGTEGYSEEAEAFVRQYESISFADVHGWAMHLFLPPPARVLDIGAGTGRDAAGFAAMGHSVTAVEPTAELRARSSCTLRRGSSGWTTACPNSRSCPGVVGRSTSSCSRPSGCTWTSGRGGAPCPGSRLWCGRAA